MQHNEIRLEIYQDDEVQAAIQELFAYQSMLDGMKAFLPESLYSLILQSKDNIKNSHDFQKNIIYHFIKFIIKGSVSKLTVSGLANLNPQDQYLFISNHRDIGLDSAFLNLILFENGFPTSQIAIGDNLTKHRIAELIFRINKSFVVKRTGTPRELYDYSIHLSNYIKNLIINKKDSVWIAQREGRAKDGNDRTQAGLLKMLSLSSNEADVKLHFQQLNIVPVAISYEYDPCSVLKVQEFLNKIINPHYEKTFQEDLNYILLGIRGLKGHVHLNFGKPLQEDLEELDAAPGNKNKLELLATIIDKNIHLGYYLHPINYIAYDLLMETHEYKNYYTEAAWEYHINFFENHLKAFDKENYQLGRKYLLAMYANPLINATAQKNATSFLTN
ncbi:MAG: 1-acyl-sn-glycerol-3-phosphate acyltransferase [Saprospiraceae bacterium]|nr:1-acyl-sn-glycerol-3-phosphate acyltransferase [Saprospiraceae bacterium]